jgi:hypothetical protein
MKLADGETSISCYPPAAPPGRGVQATLTSHRLVWLLDDSREEHYPLDKISCVTYGFERAARSVSWAVFLLLLAIGLGAFLVWAQGNLPALAESMVKALSDSETPERIAAARKAYEQRVNALMLAILPLWGLAGAVLMYAAWQLYTGIRGETRVQFTVLAVTRTLQCRGREPLLLAFGEKVSQWASGLKARNTEAPKVTATPAKTDPESWPPRRREPEI